MDFAGESRTGLDTNSRSVPYLTGAVDPTGAQYHTTPGQNRFCFFALRWSQMVLEQGYYLIICWLVVSTPLKHMKVSWDDDIPNI